MNPSITELQSELWLRGLLTIAWSDGNFDDREKELIHTFMDQNPETPLISVTGEELQLAFAGDPAIGENFLNDRERALVVFFLTELRHDHSVIH